MANIKLKLNLIQFSLIHNNVKDNVIVCVSVKSTSSLYSVIFFIWECSSDFSIITENSKSVVYTT